MHTPQALLPLLAALALAGTAHAHVTLFGPNGGEVFHGQEVVTVRWFDTISHGPLVTYELAYSENFGQTWIQIESDIPYSGGTDTYH